MRKTKRFLAVCSLAMGLTSFAMAGDADGKSMKSIARDLLEKSPGGVLGMELVPDLKDKVYGEARIAAAARDWKSLGEALELQTDYELELRGDDVLIRPKIQPAVHSGPNVARKVAVSSPSLADWKSVREALKSVSFVEGPFRFDPNLPEISGMYSPDRPLKRGPEAAPAFDRLESREATNRDLELSDVLFALSRIAGADVWVYQSVDGSASVEKRKIPRELTRGNFTFSGTSP